MASYAESDYDPPIEHLCPICLSEYTEPKLTPCGHTFCKHCLQRYVEDLRRGGQTLLELLCPVCHQLCPMPNGVGGLPTNHSTVDIMNAHKRSLRDLDGVNSQAGQCDVCKGTFTSSLASLVCEAQDCSSDEVRFCETCARGHCESNLGHDLIGICKSHGKPLRRFCTSSGCNKPICLNCHDAEHSEHDVKLYRDMIAVEKQALDSKLETGIRKITELDEQKSSMLRKVEDDTLSVKELNSKLAEGIKRAIEKNKQANQDNEAEIRLRDKQIRDNMDQNRRLGRIKENLHRRIKVEHENKCTAIESSLSEMEFSKQQVTDVIQRGKVFVNERIPLKADLRDAIRGTSEQLQKELVSTQKDWATPHLQSKNFDVGGVHELLQDLSDGVNTDRVNVGRERMAMVADAGLEYFAKEHNLEPDPGHI